MTPATESMMARATRLPIITTLLAVLAIDLQFLPTSAERLGLECGFATALRAWQLLTCQLTHWSWSHAVWDVLALAIFGGVCEVLDRRRFAVCLGAGALAIPVVVRLTHPDLSRYAGLSGLDMALVALLITMLIAERFGEAGIVGRAALLCAAALAVGKVGMELASGTTVLFDAATSGFAPVPIAHAAGVVVGVGIGLLVPPSCPRLPPF